MWFPFFASDFIGAAVGLSLQEKSIYSWMLVLYYEIGPFPLDKVRVYRIVGCESDEQKRTVDFLLKEYFVAMEDGWYQEKAEKIRADIENRRHQAHDRGVKSAEARREKYGSAQPPSRKDLESLSRASGKAPELTTTTTTTTTTDTKAKTTTARSKSVPPPFGLPEWLNPKDWTAYLEHRRGLRKPMTVEAQRRAVQELAKLHEAGHDAGAVISQSLVRGWLGLFPVKDALPQDRIAAQAERVAKMLFNDQPDERTIDG